GHDLRAEGLVDLKTVDVLKLKAGARKQRADGRHGTEAHVLRWHADGDTGDDAGERRLLVLLRIIARSDEDGRRAVDDGRRIAARLHAAEGGADFRKRVYRRRADMGVGCQFSLLAAQLERARLIAFTLERFGLHRHDLAGEKAALLRRDRSEEHT